MENKITLLEKEIDKNTSVKISYNYDRYVAELSVHINNGDGSITIHKLPFDLPGDDE